MPRDDDRGVDVSDSEREFDEKGKTTVETTPPPVDNMLVRVTALEIAVKMEGFITVDELIESASKIEDYLKNGNEKSPDKV